MPIKNSHKHSENLSAKEIIRTINRNKGKLKRYGIKKIGLFGSFLRGEQKKKSDIDLLVEFDHITFDNYMEAKLYLEKLFKRKIDLVIETNLKPAFNYVKKEVVYA